MLGKGYPYYSAIAASPKHELLEQRDKTIYVSVGRIITNCHCDLQDDSDWTTLNRFGTAEQPFLPIIPIGQREIVTPARVVLASKIPYREIFKHDAKAYAMPQEALHVWELPVSHMPGPQEQANRYYLWGYGPDMEPEPKALLVS